MTLEEWFKSVKPDNASEASVLAQAQLAWMFQAIHEIEQQLTSPQVLDGPQAPRIPTHLEVN